MKKERGGGKEREREGRGRRVRANVCRDSFSCAVQLGS